VRHNDVDVLRKITQRPYLSGDGGAVFFHQQVGQGRPAGLLADIVEGPGNVTHEQETRAGRQLDVDDLTSDGVSRRLLQHHPRGHGEEPVVGKRRQAAERAGGKLIAIQLWSRQLLARHPNLARDGGEVRGPGHAADMVGVLVGKHDVVRPFHRDLQARIGRLIHLASGHLLSVLGGHRRIESHSRRY
jgi:hypothetical protein